MRLPATLVVLPVLLSSLLALPQSLAAQSTSQTMYSPSELRELGQRSLTRAITRHGRDENPAWRRDVQLVIDSIKVAAQYRGDVVWDVVSDSNLNAAAAPGGVMIINVGLPVFCDEYGRNHSGGDAEKARAKYYGCMAAVIGHEFGHLALGHSDSVAKTIKRRQDIAERSGAAASVLDAIKDSILQRGLRQERDQELEADRAGALYVLRAGWTIQDPIDLFTTMDSLSRQGGHWKGQLTWLGGHPRSSERAAMLDGFRARLKLDQRDFDDALALMEHGIMLDSALAMLNRVQRDFPNLAAVRHAKAVVLARKWLASAPVQELKVRPSMPAYDAAFMSSIRGGDASLLRSARQGFADAMRVGAHPYTLSALAVLDAYSGDAATARLRAAQAAAAMSDDAEVQNNLGVVHFLAGRYADARQAFERASELSGSETAPSVAFNLLKTAAATGDTAAALRYAEAYLEEDSMTGWAREAREIQTRLSGGRAGKTVAAGTPSESPASKPDAASARVPVVAGIRLGASAQQAQRLLGAPEDQARNRLGAVWHYPSKGLVLIVDPNEGVRLIMLTAQAAGELSGVRVADAARDAIAKLGAPTERGEVETGTAYVYDRGSWTLGVLVRDGVVRVLSARAPIQ